MDWVLLVIKDKVEDGGHLHQLTQLGLGTDLFCMQVQWFTRMHMAIEMV